MNAMTEFTFHTTAVRVFPTEDGDSFVAVAADIAAALGYPTAAHMLRGIDDEDKGYTDVCTPGGPQRMLTLTESGVYDATFRSRNPSAKPFRRWITAEILPSIRKTGSYVRPGAAEQAAAFNLTLAQELGKMRDQMVLLTGQVIDVHRLLDGARVGHLRAEAKITKLLEKEQRRLINQEKHDAAETMRRMEAAGHSRAEIARATGRNLNHVRQVIHQARRDGLLPPKPEAAEPEPQMDFEFSLG
ncbi:MAG TPA: BRO family protein [Candidatus Competibacter sp.]|nr:BRO family protein [Candidatus Competibacter sp.]